jgi:hypothetical protein
METSCGCAAQGKESFDLRKVPTMRLRRLRFTVRTLMVAVAVSSFVFAYVGSYYRLSRRGMQEAAEYGYSGFLYVPFEEARACEDLSRHHALGGVYVPLNLIDRSLFGGPSPVLCILWRLSG